MQRSTFVFDDRYAALLFTDVVYADITDAVDAWWEAHGFPTG